MYAELGRAFAAAMAADGIADRACRITF